MGGGGGCENKKKNPEFVKKLSKFREINFQIKYYGYPGNTDGDMIW